MFVCVDVNARSTVWYDRLTDDHGEIVVDLIGRKNLMVNYLACRVPTFRNREFACLEVTLASYGVNVADWTAVQDLTSSDHAFKYISGKGR